MVVRVGAVELGATLAVVLELELVDEGAVALEDEVVELVEFDVVDELEDGSDDPPPDEQAVSRMRGAAARARRRFMT